MRWSIEAVTLRDRRQRRRHFAWKPGGFLLDGRPVTLTRPAPGPAVGAGVHRQRIGRRRAAPRARVAAASRIWVEGRHDAELVEHVWGDDLRDLGIVVEPMHGIDDLVGRRGGVRTLAARRLGVLVDHLVARFEGVSAGRGRRAIRTCSSPGTRSSTCGPAWRPTCSASTGGRTCPASVPWKEGLCRALGTDVDGFWPRLRNQVRTYADLRPELVGAVEQLLDFVTPAA